MEARATIHPKTAALLERIAAGTSPSHAYILAGSGNAFPVAAARYFVQQLMGRPDPENSVDFWHVTSEKSISIELIRELKSNIRFGPTQGSYLIALVEPADRLTHEASNALLKILEEPPAGVIFLLASSYPELLLPTIHSRCQRISCFTTLAVAAAETGFPSLSELLAMPLLKRLEIASEMATQKENAKEIMGGWMEELASKQSLSGAEQKVVKILIEKLNTFKYNVNLKLHLETVMIEIDLGTGKLN